MVHVETVDLSQKGIQLPGDGHCPAVYLADSY